MPKISLGEYGDGGVELRCLFLELVSECKNPPVLEWLREAQGYRGHELRKFLREWSIRCGIDTTWFRRSAELTLQAWNAGMEVKVLLPASGRIVPITITLYPQVETKEGMIKRIKAEAEKAGLVKPKTKHKGTIKKHMTWLVRDLVKKQPIDDIHQLIINAGDGEKEYPKRELVQILAELKQLLGIPERHRTLGDPAQRTEVSRPTNIEDLTPEQRDMLAIALRGIED